MGGIISDINMVSVNSKCQVLYDDKKIGKWWGKTLYHLEGNTLRYETFSPISLFLHLFGYKSEFNRGDLTEYLKHNAKVLENKEGVTEKVALEALRVLGSKKQPLVNLCKDFENNENSIITFFKKEGLDVNTIIDKEGTSILHFACQRGFIELTKYLLEQKAEVNTRTSDGSGLVARTPLQATVLHEDDRLTVMLLDSGADPNTLDCYGNSVLHNAIENLGRDQNILLGSMIRTHEASDPKKIIQKLLEKGAKVNTPGQNGETPLYRACQKEDFEVVRLLLDQGADPNLFGRYGQPPLFTAIQRGNLECVRLLLERGAKLNLEQPQDSSKWDAVLTMAVAGLYRFKKEWKPNPDLIALLIEKGADINQKGGYRASTPLHEAADRGDLETVKLLISLGADRSIEDDRKRKPIDVAREEKRDEVVKYLESLES